MKKNIEIGQLWKYKHGDRIHQMIVNIIASDFSGNPETLLVEQVGGQQNGLVTYYDVNDFIMRYNVVE